MKKKENFGDNPQDTDSFWSEAAIKERVQFWEENYPTMVRMFTDISKHCTPDFPAEDWLKLYENFLRGDFISGQMVISLWKSKVNPNLKPEFKLFLGENL